MTDGAEIDFHIQDRPSSWFYELLIVFDGRVTETSGTRGTGQVPEDLILRAVTRILLGEESVDVWLDVTPGLTRLAFRRIRREDGASPMTVEGVLGFGCEISKTACDESTGEPVAETEMLGVARSVVQMARAAFFMGHQRYRTGRADRTPPLSLIALEAILNAMDGVGAPIAG